MRRPTDWSDYLVIEDEKVTRIVTAELCVRKRDDVTYYSCDVYKENEDGDAWSQNLYLSIYGGYSVMFPGLPRCDRKSSWYYDKTIAEEEGWCADKCHKGVGCSGRPTQLDYDLVCMKHPDFRYVINKYQFTSKHELIDVLAMWKKHPEIELILACGFYNVGMSAQFWRMKKENRMKICQFMRKYPKYKDLSFKEVWESIKSGNPDGYAQYLRDVSSWYRKSRFYTSATYEDYLYLAKLDLKEPLRESLDSKIRYWQDYMDMLAMTHHDKNDTYWRHPKNLKQSHDKVMKELDEIALQEKAAIIEKCSKAVKKFQKFSANIGGYEIFITSSYAEWQKQANELHQCIVANGYYERMADGSCTIVFIQKDSVPVATAEIHNTGKLGQFYANELDRSNCLPSDEVREAFNEWFKSVPKSKFKPPRKKQAAGAAA